MHRLLRPLLPLGFPQPDLCCSASRGGYPQFEQGSKPFYSSPPLPALQCHPVGIVPKKHSPDWRAIYYLSYPQGDSINNHIPKDQFSLSFVRVDDTISIIQSLGKEAFMAKTDLKSAFRLILVHPMIGTFWVFTGSPVILWICICPASVCVVPLSFLTNCPVVSNGFLSTITAFNM